MFNKEIMRRFLSPKNIGELEDSDAKGRTGDPSCSDVVEIFVKFKKEIVHDAKFKVFGCPGAISTTDVFIDLIKDKKIDEALKISEEDIYSRIGGIPNSYAHCSSLPIKAFKKAVKEYREKLNWIKKYNYIINSYFVFKNQ